MDDLIKVFSRIGKELDIVGLFMASGLLLFFITMNYLIYQLSIMSWPLATIFWSIELIIIGGIIDDIRD